MDKLKNYFKNKSTDIPGILEKLYLVYLVLITVMSYKDSSMIRFFSFSRTFRITVFGIGVMLVLIKLTYDKNWTILEMLFVAILAFAFIRTYARAQQQRYMFELVVLIVGAKNVSNRKIIKTHLVTGIICLSVIMVLALTGVIENLVYYRGGKPRISFGIIYPTDFCAHVFFLIASYLWLRNEKVSYIDLGIVTVISFLCYFFCEARTTVVCLIALVLLLSYVKSRKHYAGKLGKSYMMDKRLSMLLCYSAVICFITITVLSLLYDPNSSLMSFLNKALSGRLELGHEGFNRYELSLFGQFVDQNGLGTSTSFEGEYFYLDSSYINILLRFGLIILDIVLAIMTILSLRERKRDSFFRLMILVVVSLQSMIEHHLIEIAYNPFLLLLFAEYEDATNGTTEGKLIDG